MNWTELLEQEVNQTFAVTEALMDWVEDDELDWKPTLGTNWMTLSQLLLHLAQGCGQGCRAFVTGDWGIPEDLDLSQMSPDEMLPKAEEMPAVESVREAKRLLALDKRLALKMIAQAGEKALDTRSMTAPWDARERILGQWILQSIAHLNQHKGQLFYYLKLLGKPVHTFHLWGT